MITESATIKTLLTLVILFFSINGVAQQDASRSFNSTISTRTSDEFVEYPSDKVYSWIESYQKSEREGISADEWSIESWLGYNFSQPNKLHVTEKQTVWALAYKRDYYIKLNTALRKHDQVIIDQFQSMISSLDTLIAAFKPIPEDIHVFRFQNDKFHPDPYRAGEVCLLRAYTSTSLSDYFPLRSLPPTEFRKIENRDDVWIITVPKDAKGLFMNAMADYDWDLWQNYFSEKLKNGFVPEPLPYKPKYYYEGKGDEKELLLPRNSWIRINAIQIPEDAQYTQISAELLKQPSTCNLDTKTSCCLP